MMIWKHVLSNFDLLPWFQSIERESHQWAINEQTRHDPSGKGFQLPLKLMRLPHNSPVIPLMIIKQQGQCLLKILEHARARDSLELDHQRLWHQWFGPLQGLDFYESLPDHLNRLLRILTLTALRLDGTGISKLSKIATAYRLSENEYNRWLNGEPRPRTLKTIYGLTHRAITKAMEVLSS